MSTPDWQEQAKQALIDIRTELDQPPHWTDLDSVIGIGILLRVFAAALAAAYQQGLDAQRCPDCGHFERHNGQSGSGEFHDECTHHDCHCHRGWN